MHLRMFNLAGGIEGSEMTSDFLNACGSGT